MARVLVVDDDLGVRRAMSRCLKYAGYDVVEACDPLDAAQHIGSVDAVLSDWDMPAGGGRKILELFDPKRVVIITARPGLTGTVVCSRILEKGMAYNEDIIAAIKQALELTDSNTERR